MGAIMQIECSEYVHTDMQHADLFQHELQVRCVALCQFRRLSKTTRICV